MIELFISSTLGFQRFKIMGYAPHGQRRPINQCNHTIKHHAGFDIRPAKSLNKWLRQSQTRGFDYNMIWRGILSQQCLNAGQKIISHGAADAPIRKFDNVFSPTCVSTAFLQHVTIHPDIAEFIDDQCQPFAISLHDDIADQGCLSRTKKAGDNCCWDSGL